MNLAVPREVVDWADVELSCMTEGEAAESELLYAVSDIGNTYAVTAEATYDRTVQILRSKGNTVHLGV